MINVMDGVNTPSSRRLKVLLIKAQNLVTEKRVRDELIADLIYSKANYYL